MLRAALPMRLLFFRMVVAASVALAAFFASTSARAQAITISQEQSIPRVYPDGSSVHKRATNLDPEAVSFQDCEDDQRLRVTLNMTGFQANGSFQAWAALSGTDCSTQTNRTSGTQVCWSLVTGIPLQTTTQIDIPVRKIMSGAPPGDPKAPIEDKSICGRIDLATISVQFLYFAPGALATPAAKKELAVKVDTVGPEPPSGLSTLPGNGRIHVRWDNVSGEGGLAALTGVNIYCEPSGAAAPTTTTEEASTQIVCDDASADDGAATDGDVDANCHEETTEGGTTTSSSNSSCQSPHLTITDGGKLIPDSDFNAKYKCGGITGNSGSGATADSVNGAPLTNGTQYAVSVAATDALGNVGRLSDPICETPEETNDFWQKYKDSGGQAGGGFCSTSGPGMPIGSATVLGVLVAAVVSMTRRRKAR